MSVSYIDVSSLSSTAGKKMSHKTVERATTKKVAPSKSNQSDDGYVTMRRIVRSTRQAPTTSSPQADNGYERDDDDDYSSDDFDSDDDSPDETQVSAPDYDVIDSCVPANISHTVHILIRNIVIVEHTRDRKQFLWSNQSALTYTWAAKA